MVLLLIGEDVLTPPRDPYPLATASPSSSVQYIGCRDKVLRPLQVIDEDGKDCTPKPLAGRHVDAGTGTMSSFAEVSGEHGPSRTSMQPSMPGELQAFLNPEIISASSTCCIATTLTNVEASN